MENTMNKQSDDLPLLLNAKHISELMGCSLRVAYEIMERNDFPLIRIGRMKRVKKDSFFKWLDENVT